MIGQLTCIVSVVCGAMVARVESFLRRRRRLRLVREHHLDAECRMRLRRARRGLRQAELALDEALRLYRQ